MAGSGVGSSDLRYFIDVFCLYTSHLTIVWGLVKVDISYRNIQCWEISSLDLVLRNLSLSLLQDFC